MAIEAKKALERVAEKAKQYNMYILIAGVIRRYNVNEGLLYDRNGELVWRYQKVGTTYKAQIAGTETPVFDTDFGRISCRICVDEWKCELDRSYFIKGAEMLFVPTQSWGPDGILRNLRDFSRAMDTGMFHVEATHHQSEFTHRSLILEPTGIPVAQAAYYTRGSIVSAVIDLDHDRPRRYVRDYTPHEPRGYLPQYQPDKFPKVANDLSDTVRMQRRPELYQILAAEKTRETE
jgi:predicted amidohydrolase